MTHPGALGATLQELDDATRRLVRLAAITAAGTEDDVRTALSEAKEHVPHPWIEELILQTYLFAGFPRALNAMREWRRFAGPPLIEPVLGAPEARRRGEVTCARVYGPMYHRLRKNVTELHPALDEWMIAEGYGKVLSRSALDLGRRELCIVAACAASGQDRQLHSHLHGALNVGVPKAVVTAAIDALEPVVGAQRVHGVRLLWARVQGK